MANHPWQLVDPALPGVGGTHVALFLLPCKAASFSGSPLPSPSPLHGDDKAALRPVRGKGPVVAKDTEGTASPRPMSVALISVECSKVPRGAALSLFLSLSLIPYQPTTFLSPATHKCYHKIHPVRHGTVAWWLKAAICDNTIPYGYWLESQQPVYGLRKQQKMVQLLGPLHAHGRPRRSSRLLTLA